MVSLDRDRFGAVRRGRPADFDRIGGIADIDHDQALLVFRQEGMGADDLHIVDDLMLVELRNLNRIGGIADVHDAQTRMRQVRQISHQLDRLGPTGQHEPADFGR